MSGPNNKNSQHPLKKCLEVHKYHYSTPLLSSAFGFLLSYYTISTMKFLKYQQLSRNSLDLSWLDKQQGKPLREKLHKT